VLQIAVVAAVLLAQVNELQCIAVYCSVLQCIAMYCSLLQCIAECRRVLQSFAVCCCCCSVASLPGICQ